MKRKKDEDTGNIEEEKAFLEELFPSSDDNQLVDINEPDLVTFGQLISYTAALGSMVTFYGRPGDNSIGISVRLGKRKRSVVYTGDDLDTVTLVHFVNGLKRLYLHRLTSRPESREAHKPLKLPKPK